MSKQLGINPAMDKLALDNGLGHWSCVSPKSNKFWLRSDGLSFYYRGSVNLISALTNFDYGNDVGKDWQQPEKYNIDIIRKSYGFTIDCNGQILGLINGDMGYEDTGMFVDDSCKDAINEITDEQNTEPFSDLENSIFSPAETLEYLEITDLSLENLRRIKKLISGANDV